MIEGLQIITYLPLFNSKVPGNASMFNKFFIKMSNFEIFDLTSVTEWLMYFPEEDPLSLNLQD